MKILKVKWQRLVYEGDKTCERCGATGKEVNTAVKKLKSSLKPLEIKVVLEEVALDPATCAKDVSQSNRIWIAGKPLEKWLGANTGKSPCASCCSELGEDVECRTIELAGNTYETIPADFIVQAGLLAASVLMQTETPVGSSGEPNVKKSSKEKSCCP